MSKIIGGKVVLGEEDCYSCSGKGIRPTKAPCRCVGRKRNGRSSRCVDCYGSGERWDFEITVVCGTCSGSGKVPETRCSRVDAADVAKIRVEVYRSDRKITYNESVLAFGCVYSVEDYGESKGWTDGRFVEKVRKDIASVQAVKIAREDGTVCEHLGVFVNSGGYSVRAVFGNIDVVQAAIGLELEKELGILVGVRVAEVGGNGTIAAVYGA